MISQYIQTPVFLGGISTYNEKKKIIQRVLESDSHMNKRISYSISGGEVSGYQAGDIMYVICIFGFGEDRLCKWQMVSIVGKYISRGKYNILSVSI